MITYFVDGRPQQSNQNTLSQQEILEKAGYPKAEYYLIAENGKEYRSPDDQVPIKNEEKFEVKPLRGTTPSGEIHYEVNGLPQTTATSPVPLREILEKAGRDAGIGPDDLERYRLENANTGAQYVELAGLVPINDGDKFVAIYVGSTPVA